MVISSCSMNMIIQKKGSVFAQFFCIFALLCGKMYLSINNISDNDLKLYFVSCGFKLLPYDSYRFLSGRSFYGIL